MATVHRSKEMRDYEAESDARTLAESTEILENKARHQRAIQKAKEIARKAQQTVKKVQNPRKSVPAKRPPVRRSRKR